MKKILGVALSLALAAPSIASYAGCGECGGYAGYGGYPVRGGCGGYGGWESGRYGGSVRGDVGQLDSQVPFFGIDNVADSINYASTVKTRYSSRKAWNWDFTGRLFAYLNCSPCDPCPIYVAASWQGSAHTVDTVLNPYTQTIYDLAVIPIRAHGKSGFLQGYGTLTGVQSNILSGSGTVLDPFVVTPTVTTSITVYDTVAAQVSVANQFSKAKLGLGFEFIKNSCFGFTLEVGANYLDAKLTTDKQYDLTVSPTPPSSVTTLVSPVLVGSVTQTGNVIVAPTFSPNLGLKPLANSTPSATTPSPFDFIFLIHEKDETVGLGLYASLKGEYKFNVGCCSDRFSVYGKAEVADIIGRQRYTYDFLYTDHFAAAPNADKIYNLEENPDHQYNNIVEVDLEAAVVYSPRIQCWEELDMSFAVGVRTDSFLNMFSHLTYKNNQSMWNLTRTSVFVEFGLKI
jgi:hypothetical protein